MSPESIHTLDVVELSAATGRWPRGTRGTVLELFGSEAAAAGHDAPWDGVYHFW